MASAPCSVRRLTPQEFFEELADFLAETQAQSRRVIGMATDASELPADFRLFAVYDGGASVGAFCYQISSSYASAAGEISMEAAETLVSALFEEPGSDFVGFHACDGPPSAVQVLVEVCTVAFDCVARPKDPLEAMILASEPRICVGVPGALRTVAPKSSGLPILARWFEHFEKEINQKAYTGGGHQQVLSDLNSVAARGGLFVWEVKEKPVAMAILGRTRPKQLLCVYTLPHMRGRGFGQALTAAVCAQHWFATGGTEPILLSACNRFGAARVYERVGFKSAGLLHTVTFEDCDGGDDCDALAVGGVSPKAVAISPVHDAHAAHMCASGTPLTCY